MSNENIKKKLLELSEEDRAELANMLIDSLDPETEIKNESWSQELKQRIDRYEQGASTSESWSKVKKNAQALLDK